MENEIVTYENTGDISVSRAPEQVLDEAKRAAKALADVVKNKKKPVIMNGEQYLEFEDWQTVGRFYGVTAKVVSTTFIDYADVKGFEARAEAVRVDGQVISAAEAMCLNDEPNWSKKPLFQLRSMAQTRACAKALRNVLAWVVVLAGYRPTPAEEVQDMGNGKRHEPPHKEEKVEGVITEPQRKRFYAIAKSTHASDDEIKNWLMSEYGFEHTKDIPKALYDEICKRVVDDLGVKEGE